MTWRRLVQLLAATLAAIVLLAFAWTGAALHTVAPNTTAADGASMIIDPDGSHTAIGQKIARNQRINLLFLARGGAGGDDPDYTDTVLVLSIRPATHRAVAISLPRYLWVDIPAPSRGVVQGKLYSAYALGASADPAFLNPRWRTPTGQGDLVAATVGGVIGQPIDAWVAVDIDAFEALVDAIGGITINIPTTLDDPQFPSDVGLRTVHIHFQPGTQHLDGTRALQYARSRLSTSEGDRAQRQEAVLFAILSKLKTAGPTPAAIPAAGALKDGVRTDLTPPEANGLRKLFGGVTRSDVTDIVLDGSPLLRKSTVGDGQEIILPTAGSFGELRAYIASTLP